MQSRIRFQNQIQLAYRGAFFSFKTKNETSELERKLLKGILPYREWNNEGTLIGTYFMNMNTKSQTHICSKKWFQIVKYQGQ